MLGMNMGMNSGQSGGNINGMLGGNNINIGGNNGWGMGMNGGGMRPTFAPHYEIPQVNGEAGAKSFQMAPNSSNLLLDQTVSNLVWLVQTDSAGYLTATPWDIFPHQIKPQVDVNSLEQRVKNLEGMYAAINTGTTKQSKKQRNANANANATANESATDSAN